MRTCDDNGFETAGANFHIRCYTIEDLMAMLILSRPTVCRLLKQNEFRWFKVGGAYRISKTSFDAWLNDGIIEPNPAV